MTPEPTPPQGILSDQPASEDQLDFAPYARTLADIIADPKTATPLTIGVFGSWGQGKTSLMRMVERMVTEQPAPPFPCSRCGLTRGFTASSSRCGEP
jgi:hypothetical protein